MIRFGIIGTGRIAGRFVKEAIACKDIEYICVYNPHMESLEKFAAENGINRYTNDINVFMEMIDAAYIASPHETHYDYAKKLLGSHIHVLCEKPMSFSKNEAETLFDIAKANDCVLMEALKTSYCPGFLAMMEVAKSGIIGHVRDIESCFSRLTPTNVREMTDMNYGGSFTEFGTYTLLPIIKLFGTDYKSVEFKSIKAVNGVDTYTKAVMEYENGMALSKTGLCVKSEGQLIIAGTKGYILSESPWWLTKKFVVRYEDPHKIEEYIYPYDGSGLQYELNAFINKINKIDIGVTGLDKEESIAIAGIMETFLKTERRVAKNNNTVRFWAHRGLSMEYPENTRKAFEAAANIPGVTGIELDVQLTKDGEIVVFHDENVSRVTDGNRNVQEYTLSELKKLKIDSGDGKYSTIPTLDEVLSMLKPYCESKGLLINIELKTSLIRYAGIEEKTLECVRMYGLEKYVVYSSFLPESVKHMKELDPTVKTGILAVSLEDCIRIAKEVQSDALHPYIGGLDCVIPDDMKDMPVRAWNAEEPFFRDGRVLREKNLPKYAVFGVTDVFTNVADEYLQKK